MQASSSLQAEGKGLNIKNVATAGGRQQGFGGHRVGAGWMFKCCCWSVAGVGLKADLCRIFVAHRLFTWKVTMFLM